ncbi:hypothetical protein BS47DRAFT_1354927 [Hydnum rufescens UP504]|uniref:Uncharacterized protein n=1 Tax=Hydnum rufescens UP504 TaxID=1448309 RepID=A0A9P6AFL0_9AGAM|nr:hypothetical protein BS47DRAFT_1354927 [Hydnum rufescens UP504]
MSTPLVYDLLGKGDTCRSHRLPSFIVWAIHANQSAEMRGFSRLPDFHAASSLNKYKAMYKGVIQDEARQAAKRHQREEELR